MDTHGIAEPDRPMDRLLASLGRDGAKSLASDGEDLGLERAGEASFTELWAVHGELVDHLGPEPLDRNGDLVRLEEAQRTATEALAAAVERRRHLDAAGGSRGTARRDLQHAIEREQRVAAEASELAVERAQAEQAQTQRTEWVERNTKVIDRLHQLEEDIAARQALAGAAAELERPEYVTTVIGQPPTDLDGRAAWRAAAGAIESYRARWGEVPDVAARPTGAEQRQHLAVVEAHISGVGATLPALAIAE